LRATFLRALHFGIESFTAMRMPLTPVDLLPTRPPRICGHAAAGRLPTTTTQEFAMNKDIISGKWTQLKGKMQAKWGDLTDDDFDVAEGNAQYLSGKLQERYGWDRDRAEKEVKDFDEALRKEYKDY
jgi:uncharacterized protein YjbJ (UPF0337 family)